MIQIVPHPKQSTFFLFAFLKFSENDNIFRYVEGESIINIFIFHQLQLVPKSKTKPYEKLVSNFFPLLAINLHVKNPCDPVIPSGDISDQKTCNIIP